MFYLRVVKGPQKIQARDERVMILGAEYRTNPGGVIRCNFAPGEYEILCDGKIHKVNATEGGTSIIEI